MEYLGNIIAVTVDELTRATDGAPVMTYANYKNLSSRRPVLNSFDQPDVVFEKAFDDISFEGDKITFKIPASSVMHIEVEI